MDWKDWCRLCGDVVVEQSVIKPSDEVLQIFEASENYFQIVIHEKSEDCLVCCNCADFVLKIQQFAEKCKNANNMFEELLSKRIKRPGLIENLRNKYNLDAIFGDSIKEEEDYIDCLNNVEIKIEHVDMGETNNDKENSVIIKMDTDSVLDTDSENDYSDEDFDKDPDFNAEPSTFESVPIFFVFKCHICQMTFSNCGSLSTHCRRKHDSKFACKCILCDKIFESTSSVHRHKQFHMEVPKVESPHTGAELKCSKCDKTFRSKRSLRTHELRSHLENQYLHKCPECDKSFRNNYGLKTHFKYMHSNEKPFICENCGKCFALKGNLVEHLKSHSNELLFQCSLCPKMYKSAKTLRDHEETHSGIKYPCPHCNLQLNTKKTLTSHLILHSDEKKYKCNICGIAFKRAKALKHHLFMHSGFKAYGCRFCDKKFSNNQNCRSHIKKYHPAEMAAEEASGIGEISNLVSNVPRLEEMLIKSKMEAQANFQLNDYIPESSV